MVTVAEYLVKKISTLGKGAHSLDTIYKATSRHWPFTRETRKSVIRATLQRNSRGSAQYNGKNNLFRHYGEGSWGLHTR